MTSKKEQPVVEKVKRRRLAPQASPHTASEKAQAVLAIWTERVKTAEVMKAMGGQYMTLQQWQERAMGGVLLDKRQQQVGKEKLTQRLAQLQEVAPEGKPPVDP